MRMGLLMGSTGCTRMPVRSVGWSVWRGAVMGLEGDREISRLKMLGGCDICGERKLLSMILVLTGLAGYGATVRRLKPIEGFYLFGSDGCCGGCGAMRWCEIIWARSYHSGWRLGKRIGPSDR